LVLQPHGRFVMSTVVPLVYPSRRRFIPPPDVESPIFVSHAYRSFSLVTEDFSDNISSAFVTPDDVSSKFIPDVTPSLPVVSSSLFVDFPLLFSFMQRNAQAFTSSADTAVIFEHTIRKLDKSLRSGLYVLHPDRIDLLPFNSEILVPLCVFNEVEVLTVKPLFVSKFICPSHFILS